ncbi:M23 family metallopeptidase [Curtobacterium sp. RRHDQ10]
MATQSFTSSAPGPAAPDRGAFGIAVPVERRAVVRPVDGAVPDQGNFGTRIVVGCGACSTDHQGTDFAAPTGTAIRSVLDGVVVSAGPAGGYGNAVLVRHTSGLETRYGHMSTIDVAVGERVRAGSRIGAVGSTGISTGSHLHFEVIVEGRQVDPAPWLRARGVE